MLELTDYDDSREVNAWIAVRQIQLRSSSQKEVEKALSGGLKDSGGRNESELREELNNSEPCRLAASSSTLLDVLRTMYRSQERYASGRSTYLATLSGRLPFQTFNVLRTVLTVLGFLEPLRNIPQYSQNVPVRISPHSLLRIYVWIHRIIMCSMCMLQ